MVGREQGQDVALEPRPSRPRRRPPRSASSDSPSSSARSVTCTARALASASSLAAELGGQRGELVVERRAAAALLRRAARRRRGRSRGGSARRAARCSGVEAASSCRPACTASTRANSRGSSRIASRCSATSGRQLAPRAPASAGVDIESHRFVEARASIRSSSWRPERSRASTVFVEGRRVRVRGDRLDLGALLGDAGVERRAVVLVPDLRRTAGTRTAACSGRRTALLRRDDRGGSFWLAMAHGCLTSLARTGSAAPAQEGVGHLRSAQRPARAIGRRSHPGGCSQHRPGRGSEQVQPEPVRGLEEHDLGAAGSPSSDQPPLHRHGRGRGNRARSWR